MDCQDIYDATTLKKYTEKEQLFFKKLAAILVKVPYQFPNANIPLATCINNYYSKKQPIVRYIDGPGFMKYYRSDKYDMDVYMIQDRSHVNKESCNIFGSMPIEKYLESVINSSPRFLDVFLAAPDPSRPSKLIANSHFSSILNKYKNCYGKERDFYKECPKNVRIHYTSVGESVVSISEIQKLEKVYKADDSFKAYKEHIVKYIAENKKLNKELSKLDSSLRKFIIDFYILYASVDILTYYIPYNSWVEVMYSSNEEEKQKLLFVISLYNIFKMDLYLLARLFKKYSNPNGFPSYNKYSIIYSGNVHIQIYESMLKKLGFKQKEISGDSKKLNCLDMHGISQPLFSK